MNEAAAHRDRRVDAIATTSIKVDSSSSEELARVHSVDGTRRQSTVPDPLPGDIGNHAISRDYKLEVVTDAAVLAANREAWLDLSNHAVEPNVFYEPDVLLPAIKHLLVDEPLAIILITAIDRGAPTEPPIWCGLFPFVRGRKFRGIPLRSLQLINHDYCFLRNPLIRNDDASTVMDLFCRWIGDESDVSIVEMADQTADGPYRRLLVEAMSRNELPYTISGLKARALLVRQPDADSCLRASVSTGKIKELRRLERRLADSGPLSYESLDANDDIERALEEFLLLEKSGWKGKLRSAIACRPAHQAFFESMARSLFAQGRLRMLFLRSGGNLVAAKCNLLAGQGSYAFKIAYDETRQRFSPGLLLEIESIRRFHDQTPCLWMDSCAEPDHPMINHLWKDRRMLQSWIIAGSRRGGHLAMAMLPLMQWFKRGLLSRTKQK